MVNLVFKMIIMMNTFTKTTFGMDWLMMNRLAMVIIRRFFLVMNWFMTHWFTMNRFTIVLWLRLWFIARFIVLMLLMSHWFISDFWVLISISFYWFFIMMNLFALWLNTSNRFMMGLIMVYWLVLRLMSMMIRPRLMRLMMH